MILAIPLDENKENVCVSFGRAPYFLFHNTQDKTSRVVENQAADAPGGAGIKSAQFVVDQGAEALITVRCGENAAEVFKAAEITIYKADGTSAEENLKKLTGGKLAELTSFHAGFHGKE
ncbi:MAG: dinitrogenase iron-molybdenum cofactor biosynthesis protein [Clostridia bacterium]|nr:dinitrogenase iron-molybdenum cofactor biosynthesis protein [Clostridia bacterium]